MSLNFCESCGVRQVNDVREQLELLIVKKERQNSKRCGICNVTLPHQSSETEDGDHTGHVVEVVTTAKIQVDEPAENDQRTPTDNKLVDTEFANNYTCNRSDDDHTDTNQTAEVDTIEKITVEETPDENDQRTSTDNELIASELANESSTNQKLVDSELANKSSTNQEPVDSELANDSSTNQEPVDSELANESSSDNDLVDREFANEYAIAIPYSSSADPELALDGLDPSAQELIVMSSNPCRPFMCTICGTDVSRIYNILIHLRMKHKLTREVPENPYSCVYCSERFACSTHLQKHLPLHVSQGEKFFKCKHCSATLKTLKNYKSHLQKVHGSITCARNNVACTFCGVRLNSRSEVESHAFAHHVSAYGYTCMFCGDKVEDKEAYDQHMQKFHIFAKTFCCQLCGFLSDSQKELSEHMKAKHVKEDSLGSSVTATAVTTQAPEDVVKVISVDTQQAKNTTERYGPEPMETDDSGSECYKCNKCTMTCSDMKDLLRHQAEATHTNMNKQKAPAHPDSVMKVDNVSVPNTVQTMNKMTKTSGISILQQALDGIAAYGSKASSDKSPPPPKKQKIQQDAENVPFITIKQEPMESYDTSVLPLTTETLASTSKTGLSYAESSSGDDGETAVDISWQPLHIDKTSEDFNYRLSCVKCKFRCMDSKEMDYHFTTHHGPNGAAQNAYRRKLSSVKSTKPCVRAKPTNKPNTVASRFKQMTYM